MLKKMAGDFLFAVCADDADEFTHVVGLGSAAGLLQERGLFAQFQQAMGGGGARVVDMGEAAGGA